MARFTDVDLWNLIEHDEVLKGYVGGAFADFRKLDDGVLLGEPRPERLARVSSRVVEAARNVRVVDVREHDEPEREASADGVRKYRPYDHRFIVSGHWREQAYGPNHSERRRQWIAPFVKGPRDKPLVLKDTVRVWRG